jgi:hypothetical protein
METGKIIYWNGIYGFIKSEEFPNGIFFTNNAIKYDNVKLLDKVEFEKQDIKEGKHKNKKKAINISLISKGNIEYDDEFKSYIGIVQKKVKSHYLIEHPLISQNIILYKTRLQFSKELNIGDLVIFSPVKSYKDDINLFALYAYNINHVENKNIIIENISLNETTLINFIKKNIERDELTDKNKLIYDLIYLNKTRNINEIITVFNQLNHIPTWFEVNKYLDDKYLIQLWLENKLSEAPYDKIYPFFRNSNIGIRNEVFDKLSISDRIRLIRDYYNENNHSNDVNNKLKEILQYIISIPTNDRSVELYKIQDEIKVTASKDAYQFITLWANDLLDNVTPEEVKLKLSFEVLQQLSDKTIKNKKIKVYIDNYIDELYSNIITTYKYLDNEGIVALVKQMDFIKKYNPSIYNNISVKLDNKLNEFESFKLYLYGHGNEEKSNRYFENNKNDINIYFAIRFIVKKENQKMKSLLNSLNLNTDELENKLIEYCNENTWSDLIYPTQMIDNQPVCVFIDDIRKLNEELSLTIDINRIANTILEKNIENDILRIRLWLYHFQDLDNKHFDYYREKEFFHELTLSERILFNKLYYNLNGIKEEVLVKANTVKPCLLFENNNGFKIYTANICNIYFSKELISLCKENGEYTKNYNFKNSTAGLNYIPESDELNKLTIRIKFSEINNQIITIDGLAEIINEIRNREIEESLGISIKPKRINSNNEIYYPDDFELRKQIRDYLESKQSPEEKSIPIQEIKNKRFKKLDVNSIGETAELSTLYTINLGDERLIVWQNQETIESRATYLFKCKSSDYKIIIERLEHKIKTTAQIKSFLISRKDKIEFQLFKRYLGYIGNIKKQRGKADEFTEWKKKIEKYSIVPSPEMLNDDEVKAVKIIKESVPHSTYTPSKKKNIDEFAIAPMHETNNIKREISEIVELNNLLNKIRNITSKL